MYGRGRHPLPLSAVDALPGSDLAKARFKAIVETLTGQCRVQDACARLGISEPRFQQLRGQFLAGGLACLEPGRPGRKKHVPLPTEQQLAALQARVLDLEMEQQAARLREEIALILPRAATAPPADADGSAADAPAVGPEKKTLRSPLPRRPRRRRST